MAKIVIQKGHCYRTSGSTGTTGEQELNTKVARKMAARLRKLGHTVKVVLADQSVPKSDIFVALHADGSIYDSARGASVGYRNDAGGVLGRLWKVWYQRLGWRGGFRPDNYTPALQYYYGTGEAEAAGCDHAVILEMGFLTNPDDRRELQTDRGQRRVSYAMANAIGELVGHKTLRKGMTHPAVGYLKHLLAKREHADGINMKSDKFGEATKDSLKRFQRGRGLKADGVCGPETWKHLI